MPSRSGSRDALASLPALFRARDLEGVGVSRHALRRWAARGDIEQLGRGLYRRTSAPVTELETVATAAAAVPGGVFCLLTALAIHDIGTQMPRAVWIAVDRKARRPTVPGASLRVVRFSPVLMRYGVETRKVDDVTIRVTSPARTVVDCFRYRNKVGLDVALEALTDAVRSRKATFNDIVRAAEVGRVSRVMRPYLEALAA
jgi:predicted transcriptional regulator of viral defense system